MRNLALHLAVAGALTVCAAFGAYAQWGTGQAQSQAQPAAAPPATSRGENFSAKPAPQLFASDCTGAGCHKGPQGLGKDRGQSGLTSFLREHYTNSRESAAALAAYLVGVPGDARAARPDTRPDAKPPRAARTEDAAKPADQPKPAPAAAKPPARGRQTVTAPAPPEPAPAVEPAPVAPAPPPEPPKPQWDIFD